MAIEIPRPPLELRRQVGPLDDESYDNPTGDPVYPHVPDDKYDSVFDFGCGCGRVARRMMLQTRARPRHYVGMDLNPDAIAWCQENLASVDPAWRFVHYDVFNPGLNPNGGAPYYPFPVEGRFSFINAHSVFTHIVEADLVKTIQECADRLADGGVFHSTWFFFDKAHMPFMVESQNSLYINLIDPINAVIYDKAFIKAVFSAAGLRITRVLPPSVRGFQWHVFATNTPGEHVAFPEDTAPLANAGPAQKGQSAFRKWLRL